MRQFMKKGLLGVGILLCICLVNGLAVEAMEYQYDDSVHVHKGRYGRDFFGEKAYIKSAAHF